MHDLSCVGFVWRLETVVVVQTLPHTVLFNIYTGPILVRERVLAVPRRYIFCGSFVLLMSCVCNAFASVHCCLVVT